jgi:hypothetical protein
MSQDSPDEITCPVCFSPAEISFGSSDPLNQRRIVNCLRCGNFITTDAANQILRYGRTVLGKKGSRERANLSSWIRENRPKKMLDADAIYSLKTILVKGKNILSFHQRADKLLLAIEEKTSAAGRGVNFFEPNNEMEFVARAWALDERELHNILYYLQEEGYVRGGITWKKDDGKHIGLKEDVSLASKGWARVEEIREMQTESEARVAKEIFTELESSGETYDCFISYAGEDRSDVAEPLANQLKDKGLKVWYDRFQLKLGDSIRRTIDDGLAKSRFGVVILSPSFFEKEFPQNELDALFQLQVEGRKVILPIWHRVDKDDVQAKAPLIADLMAAKTSEGLDLVVRKIMSVM